MQKFGLQTNRQSQLNAVELEIVKEKATALGRAGRKLRLSLEKYEKARHKELSSSQEKAHIKEISEDVWALILQREFLGFIDNNITWVRENYVIPESAIQILGKS